jgi:hypothetical protein
MPSHRYTLYGLVSSPILSEQRARLLTERARNHCCWPMVPSIVSKQRIGPLMYWHLKAYGIDCPAQIRRMLASAYTRQRVLAQAQAQTLAEIVSAFDTAGIESVVLKGGALAHVIYPEPGLRPMEDLDILIAPDRIADGHTILRDLGFNAPIPVSRYDRLQHHWPIAHRTRDGVTVSVELHTSAFNLMMQDGLATANMMRPLHGFEVSGQGLYTLNPIQMLWMQYLGMRKLAEPLRYIHLADLAGMAETFHAQLDWQHLRRTYPDLWGAFESIHAFTPLGDATCKVLQLDPDAPFPMDRIGQDYLGWPRYAFKEELHREGKRRLLLNTFFPPEWWARLVYGVRASHSMASVLLYRHPATFVRQGVRRLYLGPVSPTSFFKQ